MMTLLEGYADNVLALEASGTISADDYTEVLLPALHERLAHHRQLRLVYRFKEDFDGFTAGAAWEDSKVGMHHFLNFERIALVTDMEWLRRTLRGFSFALPGEVRIYSLAEMDAASAWAQEPPVPGNMEFSLDETHKILTLQPHGEIQINDFERLGTMLDPWLEEHGMLNGVMIKAKQSPGWDGLSALLAHAGFVRDHHRQLKRVALVTESRFLSTLQPVTKLLVHADVKRFSSDEEASARAWLESA